MKKLDYISIILFLLSAISLVCFIFVSVVFIYFCLISLSLCLTLNFISINQKWGGEFYRKVANYILALVCLILIVPSSILVFKIEKKDSKFVIHAGGSLEHQLFLNCVEGVETYIQNGYDLIELDFMFTKDGEIICSHLFENYENFSLTNRPTLDEAINASVAKKYSTLTLKKLIEILKENPSVKIVFDTKEENGIELLLKMLEISENENFDLKNRMIIQVYSYEDYIEANKLNFEEYWFTNYKVQYMPNKILEYFSECENVTTIVLYDHCWKIFQSLNFCTDKKLAVHTVNDKTYINFLKNRGIDYIYCDYVD